MTGSKRVYRFGGNIMAKKDNHGVVAKISDLTEAQAARLMAEIIRSKQRYAQDSRGTIGIGNQEEIHSLLHMRRRILPGKKQR